MSQKQKLKQAFMSVAYDMASVSCCERGNHACVLVSRSLRIVSVGYNGPAARLHNGCARPLESGNCGCVHAEANAVLQPRIDHPFYAFVTAAPCEYCAQLLVNAGVRTVVYDVVTDSGHDGLKVFTNAGVGNFQFDQFSGDWLGLGS